MARQILTILLCVLGYVRLVSANWYTAELERLYCGHRDCYEVLNVTRQSTLPEIRRAYRSLSVRYHPDKNKDAEAADIFRWLAKANEVLSNKETRQAYNYYLDNPDSLVALLYGLRVSYPAQTNPLLVVVLVLAFASLIQYVHSHVQYDSTVRSIKNSQQFKRAVSTEIASRYGNKYRKMKPNEQENVTEEIQRELLVDSVQVDGQQIEKIEWHDVVGVKTVCFPLFLYRYINWNTTWFYRFNYCGEQYGMEEKMYLTRRALGLNEKQWIALNEDNRKENMKLELWDKKCLAAWQKERDEEEKQKILNSAKYRQWKRWKRKVGDTTYMMED